MDWLDEMSQFWSRHADPRLVAQATEALAGAPPEIVQQAELDLLYDALAHAGEGEDPHNDHRQRVRALDLRIAAHRAARDGVGWASVLEQAHSVWLHAAKGPVLRVVDTVRSAAPTEMWGRSRDGWDTVRGVSQSPYRVVRATLNAVFNGMHAFSWAEQVLTQALRDRYPHDARDPAQTTSHYTMEVDRRAVALAERQLATVRRAFRLPDPRVVAVEPPPKPPLEWYGPPAPSDLPPVGRYEVALTPAQAAEVGVLDHMALPPEWDSWRDGGPITPEERTRGRLPTSWLWTDNTKCAPVRHRSRVRPDQRIPLAVWASATGADVDTLLRAISEQSDMVVGPAGLALDLARRALERLEHALPQDGDDCTPALSYALGARSELEEAERWAQPKSRPGVGRGVPIRRVWAGARTVLEYAAAAAGQIGLGAEVERAQQREDLLALLAT